MEKKRNWLDRFKKLFSSEIQSKQEKKERRKRWLFGRFKSRLSPALPDPSLKRMRSLREAEREQSKHAVAVAVATAAAAEAAVAAAQAAAEVVRLTGSPLLLRRSWERAATKIQTLFRGYLARRALRALKGLVKLQALIRGQAVRRQADITMKGLQSLMKIQSLARANRLIKAAFDHQALEAKEAFHEKPMEKKEAGLARAEVYNEKNWDGSILSKEEIISLLKKRQEAAVKRGRALEYASSSQEKRHPRRPTTPVDHELQLNNLEPKWRWLEGWVDTQPSNMDIPEVSPIPFQLQKLHNSESIKGKAEECELRYLARRSFTRNDDDSISSYPYFPSYMASTASTKAKFRSMSTPKQRQGTFEFSDQRSSHKDRLLSPSPSVKTINHDRSPRLEKNAGPSKHYRSPNYLSIGSEQSLLCWDRRSPFR
ncbi:Protein IQ-domain 14 [Apostasia shenzhenica]|uniref:Protein IQ-domain 14 n=1 Tax=Apostasia shenzhenica TaxID=1088818 RepID=A0A2I0ACA7_9ASPA|nr:Protein IQ-domain 14 [Apostasia shenzhenica]